MNITRLIILTWPNGYFGSAANNWKGLDLQRMAVDIWSRLGIKVEIHSITDALTLDISDADCVLYNSAENPELRSYIKDIIYLISKKTNIVPGFDHLMAHENKGFQQIYREYAGFGELSGKYLIADVDFNEIDVPVVVKSIGGAGSSGVALLRSSSDVAHFKRKFSIGIKKKIASVRWKNKLTNEEYGTYEYAQKRFIPFVSQQFIDGLKEDYKILIFSDKYYGLKRLVRKNDFRASGSGDFEYDIAPVEVLDYAERIFKKLDVPYASLDIALDNSGVCRLIEYQVLNFGPKALINSTGYFGHSKNGWEFNIEQADLEGSFVYALVRYLKIKV